MLHGGIRAGPGSFESVLRDGQPPMRQRFESEVETTRQLVFSCGDFTIGVQNERRHLAGIEVRRLSTGSSARNSGLPGKLFLDELQRSADSRDLYYFLRKKLLITVSVVFSMAWKCFATTV